MLDSPYRFIALTVTGGLLAGGGLLGVSFRIAHGSPALLTLCFGLMLLGYGSMLWFGNRVRDDVQNERWSADTLAPIRRVTEHPASTWVIFGLFAVMWVALVKGGHPNRSYWLLFVLLQMLTQISYAFRRPAAPRTPAKHIDWSQLPPLRSEHWGER